MINFDIIDSNWISSWLTICFTLVVFLFGVPLIFLQAYVPESLREHFSQTNEKAKLKSIFIILFFIVLFFGDHATNRLLDNIPVRVFISSDYFFDRYTIKFIYFVLSLCVFLLFCFQIYRSFSETIFRVNDIKLEIINQLFEKVITDLNGRSTWGKDDIEKLIYNDYKLKNLSLIYNDGNEKLYFLINVENLITIIINDKRYNGRGIKFFFEKIFKRILVDEFHKCGYEEKKIIFSLCDSISKKQTFRDNEDIQYISYDFLYELSLKALEYDDISTIHKCIKYIKEFHTHQEVLFKIHFYAFEKKIYSILTEEINKLCHLLSDENAILTKNDKRSIKNNLIAYIAFFYNGNVVMKEDYAINIINESLLKKIIDQSDFIGAQKHYTIVAKFDTAFMIYNMNNEYFTAK